MTVSATDNSKRFHGSNSTGPFTWTFRFMANTDMKVYRIPLPDELNPAGEIRLLLAEGDDYTISGAATYAGGSLTLSTALATGEDLLIQRATVATQKVSIRNQGSNFLPEVHEDVFDRLTMISQDNDNKINDLESRQQLDALESVTSQVVILKDSAAASAFASAASESGATAAKNAAENSATSAGNFAAAASSSATDSSNTAASLQPQYNNLNARMGAVEVGQSSAQIGVSTYAALSAISSSPNKVGYVGGDPSPALNGNYYPNGSGGWIQSPFDRVAVIEAAAARKTIGKNLFNLATVTTIKFVNQTTGALSDSGSYCASDWIAVAASTAYYNAPNLYYAWYTAAKVFISGAAGGGAAITSPANAAYIRITVLAAGYSTVQFEQGSSATAFEAYTFGTATTEYRDSSITGGKMALGASATNINAGTDALIQQAKIDAFTIGKNKLNITTDTLGYYVYHVTGALFSGPVYEASDWIAFSPSTAYYNATDYRYAWYTAAKVYISGGTGPGAVTSPANAAYLRVSFTQASRASAQVETGSANTGYVPYTFGLDTGSIKNLAVTSAKMAAGAAASNVNAGADSAIQKAKIDAFSFTKNLLNPATLTTYYYVNWITGALSESGSYSASDYISILPSTAYSYNVGSHYAFYTAAKVFISGASTFPAGTVSPANAAYVRVSIPDANLGAAQVEQNTVSTAYTDYGLFLPLALIDPLVQSHINAAADTPDIVLPPTLYGLVGKECSVYFDNLINRNATDFNWNATCTVGQQQDERWTATPGAAATTTLQLEAYLKNSETALATATASLVIKAASVGTGANRKILIIGDSTTANGIMVTELNTLFGADAMDITCLGTKGTAGNLHEGISGWTANLFYTDVTSPFVFSGAFNFSTYMSTHGYAGVDYVFINLGINDFFNHTSDSAVNTAWTTFSTKIEAMITNIRAYNAAIKIGICVTTPVSYSQDAFGDDYQCGQPRWRVKRNYTILARKVIDQFKARTGVDNVYLVPLITCLDTLHNMPFSASATWNSRTTMTTTRQHNGVHPDTVGYYQIADCYYYFLKGQEV
jgi:lysophospholipase L1-like esterase